MSGFDLFAWIVLVNLIVAIVTVARMRRRAGA